MDLGAETPPAALSHVDAVQRIAAAKSGVISFAGGLPHPRLFPKKQLARAFTRAVEAPRAEALQYGWPEGDEELRAFLAERLRRRGAKVEPDDVVVTSGAQQAIHLVGEVLFWPGGRVGLEHATYPGALEVFRERQLTLVDLHAAQRGEFQAAARAFYVMPALSNPTGVGWTERERSALLALARKTNGFVIEDDAYAETVFSGRVPQPLLTRDPERVFHIGTFSKTLCPGLRIGWLVAPPRFRKSVMRAKRELDLQANGLAQRIVAEYLREADFDALLERGREFYGRRAQRLLEVVRRHLPEFEVQEPTGGFSLWLEGEKRDDDVELLERAVRAGVSFDPGSLFEASPSGALTLRLCYSLVPEEEIEEGVERLARALRRAA